MKKFMFGVAAAYACGVALPASAAYVVDINQQGANVVATGSGSINLAGLGHPGSGNVTGNLGPRFGYLAVGSGRNQAYSSNNITGPFTYGTGNYYVPDSVSGLPVGFNMRYQLTGTRFVLVPFGYVSGTDLGTSIAIYNNLTLDDLGLTVGDSYTWTWGNGAEQDSFTVNILAAQNSAVPEPATWALMITGFGLTGAAMRRRRKLAVSFA